MLRSKQDLQRRECENVQLTAHLLVSTEISQSADGWNHRAVPVMLLRDGFQLRATRLVQLGRSFLYQQIAAWENHRRRPNRSRRRALPLKCSCQLRLAR